VQKYSIVLVLTLVGMFFLPACARSAPPESPLVLSPLASPIRPATAPTPTLPFGPRFTLDRPLLPNSTVVTGQGPAGVPIRIVNVTRAGRELGAGTIGPDGRFSIEVSPLPPGERIGIMLGDVTGTPFRKEDFLRGEGYVDIPMVGILFDTAMVEESSP